MKILLVEDDEPTAWALNQALTAHHYIVTIARDGQTGLELAQALTYDLVLLDVIVPKIDGITLCRHLRSTGYQSPIMLLTAKNTSTDRVMGLDAGADDYVIKPFDLEEVIARIRALLRRRHSIVSPVLTWENLTLDPTINEASYGGNLLRLTPKEYGLLELFLLNPRRIFSRSVIIDRLWSDEKSPGEETVTSHIKSLRQKLKAAGASINLIETVYGLGYRLKALPAPNQPVPSVPSSPTPQTGNASPQQQVLSSVAKLWDKFKSSFIAQVEVLQQASTASSQNQLTVEMQRQAKQEAHKLAGSLGTFGFAQGSTLAKQIEHLLAMEGTIGQPAALQLSELVEELQREMSQPPVLPTPEPMPVSNSASSSARILAIDDDVVLMERLKQEALAWNMQVEVALDLNQGRKAIAKTPPDLILLDLTFPDPTENGLTLLRELASQTPQIPVVAFTGRDSLSDRVEVARLGGRAFLQKPVAIEQIFQTITQVLDRAQAIEAKILVVDDDPIVLATLRSLLQPWGLNVVTLEHPQRFWEVFSTQAPDLLILDLEMPDFTGIDLCQVVRNDPQWSNLPILFLTVHAEVDTIEKALAAGADDYISKPIVEQELITRILRQLERVRLLGRSSGSKPRSTG
ncbi:MAG TPA: response regulator [Allocoleopsis sp.]